MADKLTYHLNVQTVLKSGSLNIMEHSELAQACRGTAKKKIVALSSRSTVKEKYSF
jgi:hypothetical protein